MQVSRDKDNVTFHVVNPGQKLLQLKSTKGETDKVLQLPEGKREHWAIIPPGTFKSVLTGVTYTEL